MMAYVYESPLDRGYIQVRLARAEHNAIYPYSQRSFRKTAEYYYNGNHLEVFHLIPLWWSVLMLIPVLVIGTLVMGAPSAWKTAKRAVRQKHYGAFTGDDAYFTPDNYPDEYQPFIDAWMKRESNN